MDPRIFDALTRRAAGAPSRRSLIGGLAGAALAAVAPSLDAFAKKKKGNRRKKELKRCRTIAQSCVVAIELFCLERHPNDPALERLCNTEGKLCCGFYFTCNEGQGDACLDAFEPLPCCPNDDDICCAGRSAVPCCPASFPICPPAGGPTVCCPANAPIPCANGSCTKLGFTCCPNNSGSCPPGKVCCDNDRCCPGGTICVGVDECQ